MIVNYSPDLMGWFGLTWQEKVAKFTYDKVNSIDKTLAKKLKDFLGAGGYNIRLINNMYREYVALMAKGNKPAQFPENKDPTSATVNIAKIINSKINVDEIIILNFLLSLQVLAAAGKIPFEKWNPQGYKDSTDLQKTFPSEVSVIDKISNVTKSTAKTGTIVIAIAGITVSLYYLTQFERLRHGKRT